MPRGKKASGEVFAEVAEPDEDGFVWLTTTDSAGYCASFNMGRPDDMGVRVLLRAAGLRRVTGGKVAEEQLGTLH